MHFPSKLMMYYPDSYCQLKKTTFASTITNSGSLCICIRNTKTTWPLEFYTMNLEPSFHHKDARKFAE